MDLNIGDKVIFWITSQGKRHRRIGIYKGRTYSGLAEVMTGYGIEAYVHKIPYNKLERINKPKPLLDGTNE